MRLVLLVLLVALLVGALPVWPYSAEWGYGTPGILLIAIIVLILTVIH